MITPYSCFFIFGILWVFYVCWFLKFWNQNTNCFNLSIFHPQLISLSFGGLQNIFVCPFHHQGFTIVEPLIQISSAKQLFRNLNIISWLYINIENVAYLWEKNSTTGRPKMWCMIQHHDHHFTHISYCRFPSHTTQRTIFLIIRSSRLLYGLSSIILAPVDGKLGALYLGILYYVLNTVLFCTDQNCKNQVSTRMDTTSTTVTRKHYHIHSHCDNTDRGLE